MLFKYGRRGVNGPTPYLRRPVALALVAGLAVGATLFLASPPPASVNADAGARTEAAYARASQKVERLWESVRVRGGDTLARILTSRGHTPSTVHEIVSSGPAGKALGELKAGTTIKVATDDQGNITEIAYAPDPYRVLTVTRNTQGDFESQVVEKPVVMSTRFAEGTITDSLFAAGKQAGVSDTVILEMADAFSYDIDFALEVQEGDTFRVIYEEEIVEGQKVRDGKVLAAEFVNQGHAYKAVRFQAKDGRAGYYTPEGLAMRKAFLRTPVDFARISSTFSLRRFHPVLHTMRAHKGVDYAAVRGTPVRATADGRIDFAGNKGGFGRVIILAHGNGQSTLYGHLNGFAKGIRNGGRVTQGQIIGYVGATGLASGPHLHYEFRVNGVHVDPLKVKTTQAMPIAAADRPAFMAEANRLLAMMDSYSGHTAVAQASSPGKVGARNL